MCRICFIVFNTWLANVLSNISNLITIDLVSEIKSG